MRAWNCHTATHNIHCDVHNLGLTSDASPFEVHSSSSRTRINWKHFLRITKTETSTSILCKATISKVGSNSPMSDTEIGQAHFVPWWIFQQNEPNTAYFPGLPVMYSQDTASLLGIANGSVGTIVEVQFAEDTAFTNRKGSIKLTSKMSSILFVDIPTCNVQSNVPSCYPKTTSPLLESDATSIAIAMNGKRTCV